MIPSRRNQSSPMMAIGAAAAAAAALSLASNWAPISVTAFAPMPPRPLSPFGTIPKPNPAQHPPAPPLPMSFYDMSDYTTSNSDYETAEESVQDQAEYTGADRESPEEDVKLHRPPPMSKNAGNTFVVMVFDRAMADVADGSKETREWDELMEERINQTGDHVKWCREANLYNSTVNVVSKVDVLRSYQVLSSCATRPIGHILLLESTDLSHIKTFLSTDPHIQSLGCEVDDIPIYRWRHIKDHTLRIDDGRYGYPNVLIQMDRPAEEMAGQASDLRDQVEKPKLEYLIRSQRVIAAGPLHLPTEAKDDPSSMPVGDIVFFNAMDRDEAIQFAENDPAAKAGLYGTMRVHKYNILDVTGKFVSENQHDDGGGWTNRNLRLKEEMEGRGYPVDDEQTEWLNY